MHNHVKCGMVGVKTMSRAVRWVMAVMVTVAVFAVSLWLFGAVLLPSVLKDGGTRWTVAAGLSVAVVALIALWAGWWAARESKDSSLSVASRSISGVGRISGITSTVDYVTNVHVGLSTRSLVPMGDRLYRVREITDPVTIGVHPGSARAGVAGKDRVPVYVNRDIDAVLRQALTSGGFVLLVGDSTAGKTRAAFEAMRAVLPDHILIIPARREDVAAAVKAAGSVRRSVLWLDDLEGYLGVDGLTRKRVIELIAGSGHHRVVLATLRAIEESRLITREGDDGRQTQTWVRQLSGVSGRWMG